MNWLRKPWKRVLVSWARKTPRQCAPHIYNDRSLTRDSIAFDIPNGFWVAWFLFWTAVAVVAYYCEGNP